MFDGISPLIYLQLLLCSHKVSMANINFSNLSMRIASLDFYCFLIFCCFGKQFFNVVVSATDTISQGQVITSSQAIVSAGGNFELGFFSPGSSKTVSVGIWYKKIPQQTVIWVANRDYAITGSSPVLTIDGGGNLVIVDGRIYFLVSNISVSQNTSATLLDSGNLVLRDGNSDVLWQSFDDSTNNFLPGMKLGYSRKTGKEWSYTSWKNSEDPRLGVVQLKMDPKEPRRLLFIRESIVTSFGIWGESPFSAFPGFQATEYIFNFNFSFQNNDNESYFTYSLKNSSILARFSIRESGAIVLQSWLDSSTGWMIFWAFPRMDVKCQLYKYCGPYSSCSYKSQSSCQCLSGFGPSEKWEQKDFSGGCVRMMALQCNNSMSVSGTVRFLRMDNVLFPLNNKTSKTSSAESCKIACLNDCFCTAYAYNLSGDCNLWDGELFNLVQLPKKDHESGSSIYIKLAAEGSRGKNMLVWLIPTVVAVPVLVFASCMYGWRKKFNYKGKLETSQDLLLFDIDMSITARNKEPSDENNNGNGECHDAWLPLFSFASVSEATDHFSAENKLGEGGFGPVYKGKLHSGREVAVKRLSRRSGQGLEELKNETMLIAKLQHRNLVRLLGCCLEGGEKILIYEYMPNKSLDSFLFDPTRQGILGWDKRIQIIEGIAQGLIYLHQYSRLRIIHRDLKASNILLDCNMNPKISDFGMARMFGGNELQANTNRIVGTYGYMSPEYAMEGLFSIKSDVFSFGVLLLEILSGKKNAGFYRSDSHNLLGHAWELWNNGEALSLMDPVLEGQASNHVLMRYINVALLCVQEIASDRPTMSEVVSMLTNELAALPSPKQPAFSIVRGLNSLHSPRSDLEACSVYEVTLTRLEGR